MGHQSTLRRAKRLHRVGNYRDPAKQIPTPARAFDGMGLSPRNIRRVTGRPALWQSFGKGRKSRIRPILNADGERIGQTHIRGADPGFPPGRCPRTFRGCQSPRAVARRAAKAAKLVEVIS